MNTPRQTYYTVERVLALHHWSDHLFSFKTTRPATLQFINGQFVMLGLMEANNRPLMRAYSIASPNDRDSLEFLSIKIPQGALTSQLQHLKPGDTVLVSKKPTGTLLLADLAHDKTNATGARHLYLLSTGTGLAPFMSLIQDPKTYARFEKVVLMHGVRFVKELAYHDIITEELPKQGDLAPLVREKLIYYPTVTREPFRHQGRLTDLIERGTLFSETDLPPLDPRYDRAMICGSLAMMTDLGACLEARGFHLSKRVGEPGDYVVERAFIGK